jgi:pyruvate kinase
MNKNTKIVCTIGPASWDYEVMKKLAESGMNVVRLNMSHGSYEEKQQQIANIKKISEELGRPLSVLADLQGPKIRLGEIDGKREIQKGEVIKLSIVAQDEELPMQFDLSPYLKKSHRVFLNDGLVQLQVTDIKGKVIITKALNAGVVSSHKGVNIPDTDLKGDSFTQKDKNDAEFALQAGVDYVAMSFVQSAADLNILKALVKKYSPTTKIISKIEKNEAINNLEAIIKASDAVMVARGDLGIETDASMVPILQQKMIKLCRQNQKPIIVATQMLESMTENPRPTRAETSDVANAVLDQVDAVMLSAESANGLYPVEAVSTMSQVITSVENNIDYKRYVKIDWETLNKETLAFNAITSSAASIAYRINAQAIVVGTVTGETAKMLSSFRPSAPIIAVVHDEKVYNQLALVWGVRPIIVKPDNNFDEFVDDIHKAIRPMFKKGDQVVIVTGITAGTPGTTNTIKIATL